MIQREEKGGKFEAEQEENEENRRECPKKMI